MLSFLFFESKAQQYFVSSSYTFLNKKTLLKIWLNPGLNLTIFRGTRPWVMGRFSRWIIPSSGGQFLLENYEDQTDQPLDLKVLIFFLKQHLTI